MSLAIWVVLATVLIGAAAIYLSRPAVETGQTAESFLLANRQLPESSVLNLLLSSSFGINALFYNGWLGYQLGLWALLIQISWAASFFLLSRYAGRFQGIVSLHDLLGQRFDRRTKVFGAICSIVGITYFVGWELSIGRSAVETTLSGIGDVALSTSSTVAQILTIGVVVLTIAYTLRGGIHGNGEVNKLLNAMKIVFVGAIVAVGLWSLLSAGQAATLLPPMTAALGGLGLWGLITNVLFNLSWQFVDNSSWQSAIAGAKDESSVSRNFRLSGLSVFLTIGFLGTLFGGILRVQPGVADSEFFSSILQLLGPAGPVVALGFVVLVVAAMMSLVDGMLLAVALTVVADLIPGGWMATRRSLVVARWTLVLVGLVSGWGIGALVEALGGSLFDFVYVVIVSQLALLGPVLLGLGTGTLHGGRPMWIAIALGLFVGFGCVLIGSVRGAGWLVDGAGTFTLIMSFLGAWTIARAPWKTSELR